MVEMAPTGVGSGMALSGGPAQMNTRGRWSAFVAPGLFAILLGASSPSLAASKPADCDAAERDKPTLDVRVLPSARFAMVTETIGWTRDAAGQEFDLTLRHGEETADLRDGVQLRVRLGGCETYTNSHVFSVPDGPLAPPDGAGWLLKAVDLLREVAHANLDWMVPLPALAYILATRGQDPGAGRDLEATGLDGDLEGDITRRVDITPEAGRTILTVSYSIHL
ncbi:MAG: hypothetical protein HY859_04325 [Caulobacterales bacterium]|nr:hypothetical protein [Caulobacterales bacterium]